MATNSNQSRGEGSHAPSKRRGTGPRTAAGKDRSKQNAIKHGLLSQVVVLNHESQSEFDDLLNGLRRNLKPEGTLEEELVGKIAVLLWRHRRFIQVEHAGIQQNIDAQQNHEAGYSRAALRIESMVEKHIAETDRRGGLFEIDEFPESLEFCLDKLGEILEKGEAYGIESGTIAVNLSLVYGARFPGRPGRDLFDFYLECKQALQSTEVERKSKGFDSQADCERKFIAAVEREIARLERHRKDEPPEPQDQTCEIRPMSMESLKLVIPSSDDVDLLMRYETHLDRALDRALIQLARAQELREHQRTIVVSA